MELTQHTLPRNGRFPDRILMTADTVGGVWQYSLDLVRGLTRYGIEVHLAAMGGRANPSQRQIAGEIPGLHLHDSEYKLEWMVDPWSDVAEAGAWLLDLAADVKPDLVHLNNFAHGRLEWKRPVLMVGHSCVYSWFNAVERCAPGAEWHRYRAEVARGLAAADAVTAPSGAMLRALRRHYGWFRPLGAIYNGADADCFRVAQKEPIIFGAGRLWDSAKNLLLLDQVADQIRWPVYLAGSNQHPDGGSATFEAVHALGLLNRAQMCEWLGKASIYVLPARYEPFGLSALEAALSGCSLVLGDIPSLREVWGDAAEFVDPGDADALGATINALIEDDERRVALATRARERARRYSLQRMWAGYLRAYSRLHRTASRPPRHTLPRQPQPSRRLPAIPTSHSGQ